MFDKNKNEIKKIEKNIGQIETEIRENLYKIGCIFYDVNKATCDEDSVYKEQLNIIGRLEAQKQGLYKEKLKLQGLMLCDHCNSIITYGSTFCNHCGQKLETDEILEKKKICPFCSTQIEEDAKFCVVCGNQISGGVNSDL